VCTHPCGAAGTAAACGAPWGCCGDTAISEAPATACARSFSPSATTSESTPRTTGTPSRSTARRCDCAARSSWRRLELERDGETVATIRKALISPLRHRFTIELAAGGELTAKGNIVDHEYEIDRDGEKVAEISKRWFRVRDAYGIEIAPDQDDGLILAVAVCIDEMAHD